MSRLGVVVVAQRLPVIPASILGQITSLHPTSPSRLFPILHSRLVKGRAMGGDSSGQAPNRLATQESPYLLQHAYNPVCEPCNSMHARHCPATHTTCLYLSRAACPTTQASMPHVRTHARRQTHIKSPIVLPAMQVDWYPWTEEAFAKARREDRPIFLSVGYSTCHW